MGRRCDGLRDVEEREEKAEGRRQRAEGLEIFTTLALSLKPNC
jgi:hypothetical protein